MFSLTLKLDQLKDDLIDMNEKLQETGVWLLSSKLDDYEEIISRPLSIIKEDRLVYQHYTASWVVMALLRLNLFEKEEIVTNIIRQIIEKNINGLWFWHNVYLIFRKLLMIEN